MPAILLQRGEDWVIVGHNSIPGFYHLRSSFRASGIESLVPYYQTFTLCLHQSQFEEVD